MNIDDFHKLIAQPMIINHIKRGLLDNAILSEDCQDIIADNDDIKAAVIERLKYLNESE